ncbi:MAG: hypothetical protein J6Z29_05020 [Ruminococcus sp.]|uniref:NfeD-like C-terminal domain-containing protein n=1 Tax=Ruminococcus albus SY3 TaxID=1341156 RepID=A0A011UGR7_RUMAL|nr:hypothetical protein [Ruminococcus albus]EXM39869.1 hypothetical protein RASY3_08960 [Ruminococcus albus SY3]MBP5267917.1 hypothetical protein [Ruminococcus sp.]
MMERFDIWWNGLSGLLKVLYCIAFPSTMLLILQTLLAMFGMHHGAHDVSDTSGLDMHTDVGGHNFDIGHDIGGHHGFDIHHDVSGGHGDIDAHHSGDFHDHSINDNVTDTSMHFFTLQTIVAFLTVFSWSSIVLVGSRVPSLAALPVGILLGIGTMALVAKMVQLSMRLAENGTVDLRNAIGESATVYIPCPPKNQGMGKITMTLQGQMMELGAFNEGEEMLKTGTKVVVVDVRGDDVIVEKDA